MEFFNRNRMQLVTIHAKNQVRIFEIEVNPKEKSLTKKKKITFLD